MTRKNISMKKTVGLLVICGNNELWHNSKPIHISFITSSFFVHMHLFVFRWSFLSQNSSSNPQYGPQVYLTVSTFTDQRVNTCCVTWLQVALLTESYMNMTFFLPSSHNSQVETRNHCLAELEGVLSSCSYTPRLSLIL